RRVDRVASPDLHDVGAASPDAAEAIHHVERLADRMGVPGVPRTRGESDDADADARRLLATGDGVEPDVAGEDVGATFGRGLSRSELHASRASLTTFDRTPAARGRSCHMVALETRRR